MIRSLPLIPTLLGIAVLCLIGAGPTAEAAEANATVETPPAEASATDQVTDAPRYVPIDSIAGLRIYVDQNGKLREPTAEEQKAYRSAIQRMMDVQRSIAPRVPTKNANGMLSMVLGLDGLSFSTLHYHDDGSKSRACVDAHQVASQPLETLLAPQGNGREEM